MSTSINKTNLVYREKVSGFIFNKNKELLIIQKPDYGDVHWDFPGGGVETGETPGQTLMRELKEELGTDKFEIVEKSNVVNQYEYPDFVIEKEIQKGKNHRGQRVLQFIVRFMGDDTDIKIEEKEIKKYKWVTFANLKEHMNFEGQWENAKEVIQNSKALKL